jgi:hypothetical protein
MIKKTFPQLKRFTFVQNVKKEGLMVRNFSALYIFILILVFSSSICAQDPDYGLKLGLNLASFTGNDASDIDRRTGLLAGGYFEKRIGGASTFRAEMFYSQKGSHDTGTQDFEDVDITRRINYIDVPLTIKIHPPEIRPLNIFVIGGLNPSFKISGEETITGANINTTNDIENLKTLDLGYVVGWGVFWVKGTHRTTLEMRFVQSLDSIYENNQFRDVKNSTISFIIGTNFRKIL